MSKTSQAKRESKKRKGLRRAAVKSSRPLRDPTLLDFWLGGLEDTYLSALCAAVPADVFPTLVRRPVNWSGRSFADAVAAYESTSPDCPRTEFLKAMLHLHRGQLGAAWTTMQAYQERHPTHVLPEAFLEHLRQYFALLGWVPEQALLWDELQSMLQRNGLIEAVRLLEQIEGRWPDDRAALDFRANLERALAAEGLAFRPG